MADPDEEHDDGQMPAVIRQQFWSRCYDGTSTYDLMEVTGLGKGSIYKAYGYKHELFLRTFRDYCEGLVAGARKALLAEEAEPSPLKRIEGYLLTTTDQMIRQSPPLGCYLTKVTVDMAAIDEDVAQVAKRAYEEIAGAFEAAVREGQAVGEVDPAKDAKALGHLMLVTIRGIDCLARSGLAAGVLADTARAAISALRTSGDFGTDHITEPPVGIEPTT
ncbi:TetR/AcrR family transcriptional regulator [Streptomyces sp. NPDC051954]|uniref:TetR/AcrR family transcriptional regulator n=1 Tax=Streptomyces sp. NPDC051954 TaxID=3155524 RepID=UPI0034333195